MSQFVRDGRVLHAVNNLRARRVDIENHLQPAERNSFRRIFLSEFVSLNDVRHSMQTIITTRYFSRAWFKGYEQREPQRLPLTTQLRLFKAFEILMNTITRCTGDIADEDQDWDNFRLTMNDGNSCLFGDVAFPKLADYPRNSNLPYHRPSRYGGQQPDFFTYALHGEARYFDRHEDDDVDEYSRKIYYTDDEDYDDLDDQYIYY